VRKKSTNYSEKVIRQLNQAQVNGAKRQARAIDDWDLLLTVLYAAEKRATLRSFVRRDHFAG